MKVRPAVPADAEALARVHWLSSNTAYGRNDPFARRLAASHRLFAEDGARPFLVEADGEVIGTLVVGDDELHAIYIHPDWWGTAAGQLLLDQAHASLAETCENATLTCLADNPRARRFYERNGWELVETLVEPHFGGVPTEVCRYRKSFSSSRS
ncbi:MAG TPA: GNAT family N-acetyltransferase [Gaiellaceae bacterium]|nr:GNAT family N-acetyltransferase [Gaiellaceae bacterium]